MVSRLQIWEKHQMPILILKIEQYWNQNCIFGARISRPYEIQVYYEDEDVVCYMIKQNPEHLYNLGSK